MSPAETGLAAFSAASESLRIIRDIIDTARQAQTMKKDCEEIASVLDVLQRIIQRTPASTEMSLAKPKLEEVLNNTLIFVKECQQSRSTRTFELFWGRKLPDMTKKLLVWVTYFTTETTIMSLDETLKLTDQARQDSERDEGLLEDIRTKLSILDDIKKNQEEMAAGELEVDFKESDSRLVFSSVSDDDLTGTLHLSASASTQVHCKPVEEGLMRFGQKGPRHVAIYSKLSARTRVHPFYGIAQHGGKRWTVFGDLRSCSTLAKAIGASELPEDASERANIALEIAFTLAYLHSVEILLKQLSDTTVLLVEEQDKLIPYLTEVEQARLFTEYTTNTTYDVRYQAPEVMRIRRHTMKTDIWSLGVIIWQIIAQVSPFGISEPVTQGEQAQSLVGRLTSHENPYDYGERRTTHEEAKDPIYDGVAELVRSCCSQDSRLRPVAAKVANSLLQVITSAKTSLDPPLTIDEEAHKRILGVIEESQQGEPSSLSPQDTDMLRRLADRGDPDAAYLLGTAIFKGLVDPPDGHDVDGKIIMLVAGRDHKHELKCRSAIKLLEPALQTGVLKAGDALTLAYRDLARLCHKYGAQHENIQGTS